MEELEGELETDHGIGPFVLALALGAAAKWFSSNLHIPHTVFMLIAGLIVSALSEQGSRDHFEALQISVGQWGNLNPDAFAAVFHSALVFSAAFSTSIHVLEREMWHYLWLAGPAAAIGCTLIATFVKYALPYEWEWSYCLLLGSILVSTDPVAVIASLKGRGVSERFCMLIEGESLFNDVTAFVLFEIFLVYIESSEHSSTGELVLLGLRLTLGGALLGLALGVAVVVLLDRIYNDAVAEVTLVIVAVYSAYLVAEATVLELSGIIAVVLLGIVVNHFGRPRVSKTTEAYLTSFWIYAEYIAITLTFFLTGLIVYNRILRESITAADWGYMVALFCVLYAVRVLIVLLSWPLLRQGAYGITWRQAVMLAHSGLRGAFSLVLVLIADGISDISPLDKERLTFLVAGCIILTVVLQGPTAGLLTNILQLGRSTAAEDAAFAAAVTALEHAAQGEVAATVKQEPLLCDTDWCTVWRYLPVLTPQQYWSRLSAERVQLSVQLSVQELEHVRALRARHAAAAAGSSKGGRVAAACAALHYKIAYSPRVLARQYTHLPDRLRIRWAQYHREFAHLAGPPSEGHANEDSTAAAAAATAAAATAAAAEAAEAPAAASGNGSSPGSDSRGGSDTLHLVGRAPSVIGLGSASEMPLRVLRVLAQQCSDAEHSSSSSSSSSEGVSAVQLEAQRLLCLAALRATCSSFVSHGRLTGQAAAVLCESIDAARDQVEAGQCVALWQYLDKRYHKGSVVHKCAAAVQAWSPKLAGVAFTLRLQMLLQVTFGLVCGLEAVLARRANISRAAAGHDAANKDPHHVEAQHHQQQDHEQQQQHGRCGVDAATAAAAAAADSELRQELSAARTALCELSASSALQARAVQTQTAARMALHCFEHKSEELEKSGQLSERDAGPVKSALAEAFTALHAHPSTHVSARGAAKSGSSSSSSAFDLGRRQSA